MTIDEIQSQFRRFARLAIHEHIDTSVYELEDKLTFAIIDEIRGVSLTLNRSWVIYNGIVPIVDYLKKEMET